MSSDFYYFGNIFPALLLFQNVTHFASNDVSVIILEKRVPVFPLRGASVKDLLAGAEEISSMEDVDGVNPVREVPAMAVDYGDFI